MFESMWDRGSFTSTLLLKVDLRSAVTRLSLSIQVRIHEYSDRLYPTEILAPSDPLSTLKWGGCSVVLR